MNESCFSKHLLNFSGLWSYGLWRCVIWYVDTNVSRNILHLSLGLETEYVSEMPVSIHQPTSCHNTENLNEKNNFLCACKIKIKNPFIRIYLSLGLFVCSFVLLEATTRKTLDEFSLHFMARDS
jgi:hypothetical protein